MWIPLSSKFPFLIVKHNRLWCHVTSSCPLQWSKNGTTTVKIKTKGQTPGRSLTHPVALIGTELSEHGWTERATSAGIWAVTLWPPQADGSLHFFTCRNKVWSKLEVALLMWKPNFTEKNTCQRCSAVQKIIYLFIYIW